MSDHFGIYYPFIHFRNDSWLKAVSLYWDQMGRIVPPGYSLNDSETVRGLKDADFVADLEPTGHEGVVARPFLAVLDRRGEELRQKFGLHLSDSWPDVKTAIGGQKADFGNPKLAYIFGPKLSDALVDDLVDLGLAERGGTREPFWVGMHPRLAFAYMTTLAQSMARHRRARPVSDDLTSHINISGNGPEEIINGFLGGKPGLSTTADESEALAAVSIAMKVVVPARLASIPVHRIAEFRAAYADERAAFQQRVKALVESVKPDSIADPDALKWHLQTEYEKILMPKFLDLKRRLKSSNMDAVLGVMNVETTIPLGAAIAVAKAPVWAEAAAAIAVGVIGVTHRRSNNRKEILREDPAVSYLYRMQSRLSPSSLIRRITTAIGRGTEGGTVGQRSSRGGGR